MGLKTSLLIGVTFNGLFIASNAEARFLQTDPVGYEDQANMYTYCANSPMNCTDPDGRRIKNIGDPIQAALALQYLSQSETFLTNYEQLVNSSETYYLNVNETVVKNQFDPRTNIVSINPNLGSELESGEVTSSASAMGHEIRHAVQKDTVGLKRHQENSRYTRTVTGYTPITDQNGNVVGQEPKVEYGYPPNEIDATKVQNQINSEIGEAQRQDYGDGDRVPTCGITSTEKC